MKLISAKPSPFGRKVKVLLHETDQLGDVEKIETGATPTDPNPKVVAANPTGKIPVLLREDGPAIFDSRVICRYLDARAGGLLYPEARLWEVLTLEAMADGIIEAALLMVYEHRVRPENMVFDDWVEAQWGKVARGVAAVNADWMSHLSGPLDMGQIAIGCALGYLDFRHDARNWREGNGALADWYEGFAQRSSMQATRPD